MRQTNLAKNITNLRKKKGLTQEQLAKAINISPQAISKWETQMSQPDVQILPLLADYFDVSIDYLFYGRDLAYGEVYEKVFSKVAAHSQMSKAAYEDALTVFGHAHHGLIHGGLQDLKQRKLYDQPCHVSDPNGVSLLSARGYGAILTRSFFEHINRETVRFAARILPALSKESTLLVCMAILSMSDISIGELEEKTHLEKAVLRDALDELIASELIVEKKSKHKSLGLTYEINSMYHTCLCILLATVEMQRFSLGGVSCCMGFGDYPIEI